MKLYNRMNLLKKASLFMMLGTALTLNACNKWLDVQPKTELKQEELFSSEEGFYEAMTGAYVTMTNEETYGRELTIGVLSVMASDYSVASSSSQAVEFLKYVEVFDYERNQFKPIINRIWLSQYNTIAQVNAILENIDAKKHLFTGENYNLVKGEALALRAYIHFDLLRLFAPAYVVKDGLKYLPYVTSYGNKSTPFSDIETIVNAALKDLNEAEELMKKDPVGPASVGADRKLRMNLYAVKGLKARIYLYKGDKPLAFAIAKQVIDAKKINLMANGVSVSLDRTFHSEHLFSLFKDRHEAAVLSWLTVQGSGSANPTPYYYTTESKITGNIFENQSTDVRFKMPMMMMYVGNLTPHKYIYQDVPSSTPEIRRNYIPLIRISELYYIAAEAAPDAATALVYLNGVRSARGLSILGSTTDIQTEIKKEYRKEFFTEGQTFFYYKRLNATQIDDSPVTAMKTEMYVMPLPEDEKIFGSR
jgi:hypothetical protein